MRAAFSKWILIEDTLFFSLITQGLGALANVGLNLLLIPRQGGIGAAVATLLSYATASYFSLFFYKAMTIFVKDVPEVALCFQKREDFRYILL